MYNSPVCDQRQRCRLKACQAPCRTCEDRDGVTARRKTTGRRGACGSDPDFCLVQSRAVVVTCSMKAESASGMGKVKVVVVVALVLAAEGAKAEAMVAAVASVARPVHSSRHRARAPVHLSRGLMHLALVLARLSRDSACPFRGSVRLPGAALHILLEQHHLVLAVAAPGLARESDLQRIPDVDLLAR